MTLRKHARTGFTLIELLTVIAIIAILAALIFPTFSRVREQARLTSCMTQMREAYTAMRLYREDNSKFPATLLGFVQFTDGTGAKQFYTGGGEPILPIEQLSYRPLTTGQKYIRDKNGFLCPDNLNRDPSRITPAVYPQNVPLAGQPALYTQLIRDNCCRPNIPVGQPIYFYQYDSYTTGPQVDNAGQTVQGVTELHYSLDWTGEAATGPDDRQNQLKYPDPPQDATVITWCTYHAAVAKGDKVPVLMLSGKVSPVPVSQFFSTSGGPLGFRY